MTPFLLFLHAVVVLVGAIIIISEYSRLGFRGIVKCLFFLLFWPILIPLMGAIYLWQDRGDV